MASFAGLLDSPEMSADAWRVCMQILCFLWEWCSIRPALCLNGVLVGACTSFWLRLARFLLWLPSCPGTAACTWHLMLRGCGAHLCLCKFSCTHLHSSAGRSICIRTRAQAPPRLCTCTNICRRMCMRTCTPTCQHACIYTHT